MPAANTIIITCAHKMRSRMSIKFEKNDNQLDQTWIVQNTNIVGYYVKNGNSWQWYELPRTLRLMESAGVGGISENDFRELIIAKIEGRE